MQDRPRKGEELETVIRPIIEEFSRSAAGKPIKGLDDSVLRMLGTDRHLVADPELPYRAAKQSSRRFYILHLLRANYGNIRRVAGILCIDRRQLHRLIRRFSIDCKKIKKEMPRPYALDRPYLESALGNILSGYSKRIGPEELSVMYSHISRVSDDISQVLPAPLLTLKEADEIFERKYFAKLLVLHKNNLKSAAKSAKIRYETLVRKLSALFPDRLK